MKQLTRHLYFWVLLAILAGGTLGYLDPATAVQLKPLGDGFIALVKMLISPIIFCTVVLGIAGAGDMKKVGRVGGKALLYFEVVSTLALAIGLVVVSVIRPGAGFNVDPATLNASAVADYAKRATSQRHGLADRALEHATHRLGQRRAQRLACRTRGAAQRGGKAPLRNQTM